MGALASAIPNTACSRTGGVAAQSCRHTLTVCPPAQRPRGTAQTALPHSHPTQPPVSAPPGSKKQQQQSCRPWQRGKPPSAAAAARGGGPRRAAAAPSPCALTSASAATRLASRRTCATRSRAPRWWCSWAQTARRCRWSAQRCAGLGVGEGAKRVADGWACVQRTTAWQAGAHGWPASPPRWLLLTGPTGSCCLQGGYILDAGLDAGLELPYTCKGGICGCCVGRIASGEVDDSDVRPRCLRS